MSNTRIAYVQTGEVRVPKLGEFCEMSLSAGGVAVAGPGWETPRMIFKKVEIADDQSLAELVQGGFVVTKPDGNPVDPSEPTIKPMKVATNESGERVLRPVADEVVASEQDGELRRQAIADAFNESESLFKPIRDVENASAIAAGMLANQVFLDGLTAHHAEITKAERDAGTAPDFDLAATVAAEAVRVVDEIKKLVANR